MILFVGISDGSDNGDTDNRGRTVASVSVSLQLLLIDLAKNTNIFIL